VGDKEGRMQWNYKITQEGSFTSFLTDKEDTPILFRRSDKIRESGSSVLPTASYTLLKCPDQWYFSI
jgi:hypothetical protein